VRFRVIKEVQPETLGQMVLELQKRGCRSIKFVTLEHVVSDSAGLFLDMEMGLKLLLMYSADSVYNSRVNIRLTNDRGISTPDFKYGDEN